MGKRILSCLFIVLGMFPKLAARETAVDTSEIGNAVILKEQGIASMLAQRYPEAGSHRLFRARHGTGADRPRP